MRISYILHEPTAIEPDEAMVMIPRLNALVGQSDLHNIAILEAVQKMGYDRPSESQSLPWLSITSLAAMMFSFLYPLEVANLYGTATSCSHKKKNYRFPRNG